MYKRPGLRDETKVSRSRLASRMMYDTYRTIYDIVSSPIHLQRTRTRVVLITIPLPRLKELSVQRTIIVTKNQLPNVLMRTFDQISEIKHSHENFGLVRRSRVDRGSGAPFTPCSHSLERREQGLAVSRSRLASRHAQSPGLRHTTSSSTLKASRAQIDPSCDLIRAFFRWTHGIYEQI
jgi:hypothetical protein